MAVQPSCPVLLIHDDDAFRKALIASLDRNHFAVTFTAEVAEALAHLRNGSAFHVVLVSVNLKTGEGLEALDYLRDNKKAYVIVLSESNPDLRAHVKFADETLLKPVDAEYVVERARSHCH